MMTMLYKIVTSDSNCIDKWRERDLVFHSVWPEVGNGIKE